jgi:hypothetical protein
MFPFIEEFVAPFFINPSSQRWNISIGCFGSSRTMPKYGFSKCPDTKDLYIFSTRKPILLQICPLNTLEKVSRIEQFHGCYVA